MTTSNVNEDYLDVKYWNSRYEEEAEFDWCKDYDLIKSLINEKVNRNDSILMLGKERYNFKKKKILVYVRKCKLEIFALIQSLITNFYL